MDVQGDVQNRSEVTTSFPNFLYQRYFLQQVMSSQESIKKKLEETQQKKVNCHYEQYQHQQYQNEILPETFFRPWEHPVPNQQANVAVVRPFCSNSNLMPKVTQASSRDTLHKKLLKGNHLQYQQNNYHQQNCIEISNMNNVSRTSESVILNRALLIEPNINEITPKSTLKKEFNSKSLQSLSQPKRNSDENKQNKSSKKRFIITHDLDPESENSNDLVICEEGELIDDEQSDDSDDLDSESISSESSSSSSQPLDLRTTKIPYSSTPQFEISVIRSLSPVPVRSPNTKESVRDSKSRKLKTKRRICTACNRTYLKTKNLRWHFKSKLHKKRVSKLGIDDPADRPDTWYKIDHNDSSMCSSSHNIISSDLKNE